MKDTLIQLLQPFNYLRIYHPQKLLMDWGVPLVISILIMLGVLWIHPKINVYGPQGLIQSVTGFLQTLPGFYIAALAAIVTFSNERMDQTMPGDPPPKIKEMSLGKVNVIPLTRRRFLSLMFAFLTAESILIVIIGLALILLAPSVREWECILRFISYVSAGGLFVFLFLTMQMAVATFWGLFYLGTKIHSNAA